MADEIFSDRQGRLSIVFLRDGPRVGPDSRLIKLQQRLTSVRPHELPRLDCIKIDTVAEVGLLGHTHILDCRFDDPENFRFLFYGKDVNIENHRDFEGQRVGDAEWRALRNFGAVDYGRVKARAAPDFSVVECLAATSSFTYRRMVLPLSETGRGVTHLLVSTVAETSRSPA